SICPGGYSTLIMRISLPGMAARSFDINGVTCASSAIAPSVPTARIRIISRVFITLSSHCEDGRRRFADLQHEDLHGRSCDRGAALSFARLARQAGVERRRHGRPPYPSAHAGTES